MIDRIYLNRNAGNPISHLKEFPENRVVTTFTRAAHVVQGAHPASLSGKSVDSVKSPKENNPSFARKGTSSFDVRDKADWNLPYPPAHFPGMPVPIALQGPVPVPMPMPVPALPQMPFNGQLGLALPHVPHSADAA